MIARLSSADPGFAERLAALLAYEPSQDAEIERAVAAIVADVRARGDAALLDCTRRFDRVDVADAAALELPRAELEARWRRCPPPAATRSRPPPPGCAPTTSTSAPSRGRSPTPTATGSGRRSPPSTGRACTCRAARPPTRRRC
jgi:hypothetical protein